MSPLRPLEPDEASRAAEFLDPRTWALRWLVAFLWHYEMGSEEAGSSWRLFWDGGSEGILAHFFHNGTTYVFGEGDFAWDAATRLCHEDFLPERIVGDRLVVKRWRERSPEAFQRVRSSHEMEVLAREPAAGEAPPGAPPGFRVAVPEEWPLLEEYERLHCREVGLDPMDVDFKRLVENKMIFVVEHQGKVAGCVCSNRSDGRYVHVGGLYVHPDFRGQRLGQRLAEGMAWWVQEHQHAGALLDAYTSNHKALRMYQRAGYSKVGEGLEVRFERDAWG